MIPIPAPTARKIIAVVGAENAPGLGLVRAILEDLKGGFAARAVVRDLGSPESRLLRTLGADLLVADPLDEAALKKALAGAYGAFHIELSSEHPSPETRLATTHALARAAKGAGLRHLVWATLEDPGRTFLEQTDVTPTFHNGRWVSDRVTEKSPDQIFAELAVPTTVLHTSWEPSVAAGKWTEDIGRHAYGILRNRESVGQTVSISAARLVRRLTPPPLDERAIAPVAVAAPLASVSSPPIEAPSAGPSPSNAAPSRVRTLAIVGMIVAVALVGLVIARQIQSQKTEPARESIEPPPRAAEPVRAPPPAAKVPATSEPAAPVVADPPEAPPGPPDIAAPTEPEIAANNRSGSGFKHIAATAKPHKHEVGKPVAAGTPSMPTPPEAPAPAPPAPQAKVEHVEAPPPRVEPSPPQRELPGRPASAPVVAVRAPPPPAPEPPKPAAQQPGFVDPKAVSATVRAHAEEANACYDRAIMEHPELHGRLTFRATVDPMGRVVSLSPTTNGIEGGGRLQSCLFAAFKSWTFPRPAGGVNGNISYSFAFER